MIKRLIYREIQTRGWSLIKRLFYREIQTRGWSLIKVNLQGDTDERVVFCNRLIYREIETRGGL